MRLAWFSPWPPQRSGVAGRSAALVRQLAAGGMAIDVFVDSQMAAVDRRADPEPPQPGEVRIQSAHDAVWRLTRGQYDLAVYQLGNSHLHDYIWPYLFRWPGLAVLHDARLHHARGQALLSHKRAADYRVEFAFNHPDVARDTAELAVAGFDGPYYYLWPMIRAVVLASRMVATHTRGSAEELAASWPTHTIEYVALGDGRLTLPSDRERHATRAALGLDDTHVVFGAFGALTAEKRLPQILRAFARTRRHTPDARLLLAGAPDPAVDLSASARALDISDAILNLGVLDDEPFQRAIAAVDVSLNLRWPTAVETSGPWLNALAAGRATIITALQHQSHVPALDPRSWPGSSTAFNAVAVAVDIVDEEHSLTLAMRRLAADAALRVALGRSGRAFWEREHTEARMVDDYRRVIAHAASLPNPSPLLPAHLRPDPLAHTRDVLAAFPEVTCELR